jgi:hypothetical protein
MLSDDVNGISLPQQYIRTFNVSIRASSIPVPPGKSGLPGWAIALIVVGSVLVLAGLGFVGYKIYLKKKQGSYQNLNQIEESGASGN